MNPTPTHVMIALVLLGASTLAGCLGVDPDPSMDPAEATSHATSESAQHPVSLDIGLEFHVYYVGDGRCASEIVHADGPISNINITATWDHGIPIVGDKLELRVFNGTDGAAGGHAGWPQGDAIAHQEGGSPLTLDVDVAAGDHIRLVVCDWSHVAVREAFDVHVDGSLGYLAPTAEAV